jgi:uncharacterized membrane protein
VAEARISFLLLGAALALLAIIAVDATPQPIRLVATLPVVLFFPGFFLLRALAPWRSFDFESLVLTLGLSLAATIVTALALHMFQALTPAGWVAAFGALFLVASAPRLLPRTARVEKATVSPPALRRSQAALAIVSFTCVVGLVTAATALAHQGAVNHREFAYTELWMLRSGTGGVTIGVKNEERQPVDYELEVLVNGSVFARWPSYVVENDEQRLEHLAIPIDDVSIRRVEARLYRTEGYPTLYRQAWLSKGGTEGP